MIIVSYIVRKVLKKQISVFLILLLTFFCQNFFRMLDLIKDKNLNKAFFIFLFGLNIPKIFQFIFPFSIYLGMLITFIQIQENNELLAIYICGINKKILIISVLILNFFFQT